METVNIYEAKTRLSQLVDKAAAGEDVVVSRNGKPVARLTRLEGARPRIRFGLLKGKLTVPADFDAPLPAELIAQAKAEPLRLLTADALLGRYGDLVQVV